jgi:hypothetical protein
LECGGPTNNQKWYNKVSPKTLFYNYENILRTGSKWEGQRVGEENEWEAVRKRNGGNDLRIYFPLYYFPGTELLFWTQEARKAIWAHLSTLREQNWFQFKKINRKDSQ